MEDNGRSLLIIKKKNVKFSLLLSNCYFGLVTFRKEEKPAVALLVAS